MGAMGSREAGLLLAQQLFQVDDLHYGWWDEGDTLSLGNLPAAQQRYNNNLLDAISARTRSGRVLDIGCGTGRLLSLLLERGYQAEGVIPSATLDRQVRSRLERCGHASATVHHCRFEDFPADAHRAAYDVAIFSESFQYIPMDRSLKVLASIMKPGGIVLICDFFRDDSRRRDGDPPETFGGGHLLSSFYPALARAGINILSDRDITARMSPNLDLVEDLLVNRLQPAVGTIDLFLRSRYPMISRSVAWLLRKKIAKVRLKYLSGRRNRAEFERSKSYRFILSQMPA